MPRLALAAVLLATLPLGACDTQRNDLFGEFEAEVVVDGVVVESPEEDEERDGLSGEAVYTLVETENGTEFVLGLFVGDLFDSQHDDYQYLLFRVKGGIPSVGAYAIDDTPEYSGAKAVYADVEEVDGGDDFGDVLDGEILTGTDGTLAISAVDGYSVRGSFRFDARGVNVRAPDRFVEGLASGQFEAVYERPSLVLNRGLELR